MGWIQIRLDASAQQVSVLSELLSTAGAVAVSLEDADDDALYEPSPGSLPLWTRTRLSGLFEQDADVDAILGDLGAAFRPEALPPHRVDHLADQDWQRACRAHFLPRRFGDRLWICPTWCPLPEPGAAHVRLDPGLAFGTGAHATTALCLEWLARARLEGATVIDYGCGSGILAIAAANLGARTVWAVDIDPQALQAAADNARANRVETKLVAVTPEALPAMSADVLMANILARPLIALAQDFAARVRPGGRVVLSGILGEQADDVSAAYAPRFVMAPPVRDEEWVRLEGVRR
jgi:ribosomal protein L11 methyltransferase